ncbi:MAG: EhaG family protein [Euryarchaeota archaeon]|nr:EhaG family protein [Euryarchaeota archaeon]MBU4548147.1 EhaG family protein [Euryarchaeota archaeon]MBU4607609.1 EhaG family protein [Euryarchaeota archaeon]MBV1755840.1 EhaG family protein [Methanobacterium sp.]MBV1767273.1 EhaG family protein [Methanobacterium sp.]
MIVPEVVPAITVSLFLPALYVGLLVGFIALLGISFQKKDLHALILTDIVGVGMLIIVAAVGTDLAEALILPGLVVQLAEIMAISEILMSREMRKTGKKVSFMPMPLKMNMEILKTAPNFLSLVLIVYGIFLTGFTGGAVAGVGILFYALSRKSRGLPFKLWEGVSGISGVAWCIWLAGFLILFVTPEIWLLGLLMSSFGILLKVASKMGLIGVLGREEIKRD